MSSASWKGDDLATLEVLDERVILENLHVRYVNGQYYTYIGDVLVAVNPFKPLQIYGPQEHERYTRVKNRADQRPHIFWVADAAYQRMRETNRNQCILVSGESGSGKTETSKLVIQHVTHLCPTTSDQHSNMHQKIVEVNPLLEAFGNARTAMNHNSSRFGKFVDLHFTQYGKLIGAKISDYLLEKSRIVQKSPTDRNFHVFYYLFAGMPKDMLEYYSLDKPEKYRILQNVDNTPIFESQSHVNHCKDMFQRLHNIMKLVGFNAEDIATIYTLLSSVLHTSNIEFVHDDETDGVYVEDETPLDIAANLLGLNERELAKALISNVSRVSVVVYENTDCERLGEDVVSLKNQQQAKDGRDALAKALYERLFGWIVAQINNQLQPTQEHRHDRGPTIGILDISGFENFTHNSFEQLCINVANEQLQFHFNNYIFVQEQQDYELDGVDWKVIEFKNNEGVLHLFMEKHRGLFDLLDEETKFPKATDDSLVQKLTNQLQKKEAFVGAQGNECAFAIKHYASDVIYVAKNFLAKNRDRLSSNIVNCMQKSQIDLIKDLFTFDPTTNGGISRSASNKRVVRPPNSPPQRRQGENISKQTAQEITRYQSFRATVDKGNSKYETLRKSQTVVGHFKASLGDMMEKVSRAVPWFVRCIKPNNQRQKDKFQANLVTNQLRYNGILEIAKIRKSGYPVRMPFGDFLAKYKIICFDTRVPIEPRPRHCLAILETTGKTGYILGRSKVFMKDYIAERLNDMLKKIRMTIEVQKHIRGYLARKEKARLYAIKKEQEREERRKREMMERAERERMEKEKRKRSAPQPPKSSETTIPKSKSANSMDAISNHSKASSLDKRKSMEFGRPHKSSLDNIPAASATRSRSVLDLMGQPASKNTSKSSSIDRKDASMKRAILDGDVKSLTSEMSKNPYNGPSSKRTTLESMNMKSTTLDSGIGADNKTGSMKKDVDSILDETGTMFDDEDLNEEQWDVFQMIPRERQSASENFEIILKLIKVFMYFFLFVVVLGSAVISKVSLLILTSGTLMTTNYRDSYSWDGGRTLDETMDRNTRITLLVICLCVPYSLSFITFCFKALFGSQPWPKFSTMCLILMMETMHSFGLCLLLFRVLPSMDMVRGLMLLTVVCTMPGLLGLMFGKPNNQRKEGGKCAAIFLRCLQFVGPLLQLSAMAIVIVTGFAFKTADDVGLELGLSDTRNVNPDSNVFIRHPVNPDNLDVSSLNWEVVVALLLISISWWENFADRDRKCGRICIPLRRFRSILHGVREKSTVIVSLWKIVCTIACAYILLWSTDFKLQLHTRDNQQTIYKPYPPEYAETIQGENGQLDLELRSTDNVTQDTTAIIIFPPRTRQVIEHYAPAIAQAIATYVCYYFGRLGCKLCMQRFSFSAPLMLATPVTFVILFLQCKLEFLTSVTDGMYTWTCPETSGKMLYLHFGCFFLWWISELMIAAHIWFPQSERLAKAEKLFVLPFYCAGLIEQSLMMNRRRRDKDIVLIGDGHFEYIETGTTLDGNTTMTRSMATSTEDLEEKYKITDDGVIPKIYACATMWHETRDEMTQLLKSIFRMDFDQCARRNAQEYFGVRDPDYYEFETHILFDDSMELNDNDEAIPNQFVLQFLEVIDAAASSVHESVINLHPPEKIPTPYGGRLVWTLPGGTKLNVHMKDKNRIRHRKRWSQVMYMYYLLGFNLMAKREQYLISNGRRKKGRGKTWESKALKRRTTKSHYTKTDIFDDYDESLHVAAENTYILTLDGDVDFKPDAVRLLMDRLKKNKKVGAACGRIHPIGQGPMVWFQKFEYAIGHWLQKAAEHIYGCVLCAPGCFSLFRGSALMDDNVVRQYAVRATEAQHYVQFDQGEDRWLCTLLLQQGYRIEYSAASDALTHAPESFNEFFNQRKRWGPSTMANIVDLLQDYSNTVSVNDNISNIYMLYQFFLLVSTVLGPATVMMTIAGAFNAVLKVDLWQSFGLSLGPALFFILICIYTKPNTQLMVAATMSALYSIVMMVVIVGTIINGVQESWTSPNVVFITLLSSFFLLAAIFHPQEFACIIPGPVYFLAIPAGYLVLTIYALSNMNNVSWGTREIPKRRSKAEMEAEKKAEEERKKKKAKTGFLAWIGLPQFMQDMKDFYLQLMGTGKQQQQQSSIEQLLLKLNRTLEDLPRRMRDDAARKGGEGRLFDDDYYTNAEQDIELPLERMLSKQAPQAPPPPPPPPPVPIDQEIMIDIPESSPLSSGSPRGQFSPKKPSGQLSGGLMSPKSPDSDHIHVKDAMEDTAWLHDMRFGNGPQGFITQKEAFFWRQFINRYLYPLNVDKDQQKKIAGELKQLRDNVVFAFFMLNLLWIVIIFQLQILQEDLRDVIYVTIPRADGGVERFEPLGLAFLSLFALILLLQFTAMIIHRWGTLLHLIAITEVNFFTSGTHSYGSDVQEAIRISKELQKIKGIKHEQDDQTGDNETIYESLSQEEPPASREIPSQLQENLRMRLSQLKKHEISSAFNGRRSRVPVGGRYGALGGDTLRKAFMTRLTKLQRDLNIDQRGSTTNHHVINIGHDYGPVYLKNNDGEGSSRRKNEQGNEMFRTLRREIEERRRRRPLHEVWDKHE